LLADFALAEVCGHLWGGGPPPGEGTDGVRPGRTSASVSAKVCYRRQRAGRDHKTTSPVSLMPFAQY